MPSRFVSPYATGFSDTTGKVVPGGRLFFYASGTANKKDTFSDVLLAIPNSNPVIANSAGRFPAIFSGENSYKVIFAGAGTSDPPTNEIWTADPYQFIDDSGGGPDPDDFLQFDVDVISDRNVKPDDPPTSIDGIDLFDGMSALFPIQSAAVTNGIYNYDASLLRFVRDPALQNGDVVNVKIIATALDGEINGGQTFECITGTPYTIGTDPTTWQPYSGTGLVSASQSPMGKYGSGAGDGLATNRIMAAPDFPTVNFDQAPKPPFNGPQVSFTEAVSAMGLAGWFMDMEKPYAAQGPLQRRMNYEHFIDFRHHTLHMTAPLVIPPRSLVMGSRSGVTTIQVDSPAQDLFQMIRDVDFIGDFQFVWPQAATTAAKGLLIANGGGNIRLFGRMRFVNCSYMVYAVGKIANLHFDWLHATNLNTSGLLLQGTDASNLCTNVRVGNLTGSALSTADNWLAAKQYTEDIQVDRAITTGAISAAQCYTTSGTVGPKRTRLRNWSSTGTTSHGFNVNRCTDFLGENLSSFTAGGDGLQFGANAGGDLCLTNPTMVGNGTHGINCLQTVDHHTEISNPRLSGNSAAASGTSSGLIIADTVINVKVWGGYSGKKAAADTAIQKYGGYIAGTTHSDVIVEGMNCNGNVTAATLNDSTVPSSNTSKFINCAPSTPYA